MNTMMLALLQGRLWDTASSLQQRLQAREAGVGEASVAGELSQVFRALDAVKDGRYGFCDDCDEPLEPDVLLMQPHLMRCPACEALSRRRAGAAPN